MTEIFVLMFNLQGWYFLLSAPVCVRGNKMILCLEAKTDFNGLKIGVFNLG